MTDPNQIPSDVAPPRGLTLDALDMLDTLARDGATVTEPGQVHLDVDGTPIAVAPPRVTRAAGAIAVVAASDLTRLGVTVDQARERWPNVRIVDTDTGTGARTTGT